MLGHSMAAVVGVSLVYTRPGPEDYRTGLTTATARLLHGGIGEVVSITDRKAK